MGWPPPRLLYSRRTAKPFGRKRKGFFGPMAAGRTPIAQIWRVQGDKGFRWALVRVSGNFRGIGNEKKTPITAARVQADFPGATIHGQPADVVNRDRAKNARAS